MKFGDNVGDPSYFLTPLPDCLCHVSFTRYSPLSLKSSKNRTNLKVFWPQFLRERRPQLFYGRLLARPTVHRLAKFVWVPFADLRLRSLAMKWNADFTKDGWNSLPIWSRLWTKVHVVLRRCSRSLVVCNALVRRYRPLKLPLSCKIAKKGGFGAPNL